MGKGLLNKIAITLLLLYCVAAIAHISTHKHAYQWDFYGYYKCIKAYENGTNPYDTDAVSQKATRLIYPFVYPPLALFFFQVFTKFDYNLAFHVFLILKCILTIGLIYLWRNIFLDRQVDTIFYLLCLFAFNGAFYLDLRAGNISIFEQFLIWFAFFCYLKHKFTYFCTLIIITAIFKIQPILFLFLLLFVEHRNKYKYLITSFTVFGIILLAQFIFSPYLFLNFLVNATSTMSERGIINPSTFTCLRDLLRILSGISDVDLLNKISLAFHFIVVTVIIFVSRTAYIRLNKASYSKTEEKEKWLICLSCLIYALIAIRFKDYSYILLILPAYFIIKKTTSIKVYGLLFFLISISAVNVTLPGISIVANFLWNYYSLFIAYFLWGMYLYKIHRNT